jgi:uncharacterized phage protein (TIGR01671 family)
MREIKFRAWRENKMHFNITKAHYEHNAMSGHGGDLWDFNEWLKWSKVMQYTGLKDKNGVEIYEGDILEWGMSHDQVNPFPKLRFVEFYEPQLIYKAVEVGDLPVNVEYLYEAAPKSTRWCRVVGNIFENPQLLDQ